MAVPAPISLLQGSLFCILIAWRSLDCSLLYGYPYNCSPIAWFSPLHRLSLHLFNFLHGYSCTRSYFLCFLHPFSNCMPVFPWVPYCIDIAVPFFFIAWLFLHPFLSLYHIAIALLFCTCIPIGLFSLTSHGLCWLSLFLYVWFPTGGPVHLHFR